MRCDSASWAIARPTRLFGLAGRSNTPTSAPAVNASNTIEALSGVTHTVPHRASCSGSQSGEVAVWGTMFSLGCRGSSARKSAGVRREVVSVHCMSGLRARMRLICAWTASLSHSKCGEAPPIRIRPWFASLAVAGRTRFSAPSVTSVCASAATPSCRGRMHRSKQRRGRLGFISTTARPPCARRAASSVGWVA